ncbi:MAG: PspC domain-containing protein [Bacteroidales bacterium]|jgi:phage shock protein PspC (stress-responsive transcriptional regulator)|nr:PspC domain-containing protein [Bacteroidales bacterium]
MESKRLYRSLTDRKIAGVAGGLGEYFVMDPLLIRLVFVILLLAGGGGFIIYLVLWIVTPENPYRVQTNINHPVGETQPFNETASGADNRQPEYESQKTGEDTSSGSTVNNSSEAKKSPLSKHKRGSLIGGLVLITIGALFLADELIPQVNFGDLWPLILVAIGVGLLINAITNRQKETNN